MPIVTLTSDLGSKDSYVPMIKGSLITLNQNLNLVDISHDIPAFDVVLAEARKADAFRKAIGPKGRRPRTPQPAPMSAA